MQDSDKVYRESDQRNSDYASVFAGEQGERVLEDILAYCHVLAPMGKPDPNESLVREARRDVANMILSAMHFNPKQYEELFK